MITILIIDDSFTNLYLLRSIFDEDQNVEVILESESRNALKTVNKHKPDLIFLDLMMPRLDGLAILRQIKANPDTQKIPVIMISANNNPEKIKEAMAEGAAEYLKKPISIDNILKIKDSILKVVR